MAEPELSVVSEKIALIIGQTDYTADEAELKLKAKNYDEISVIREYLVSGNNAANSNRIVDQKQSKNQLIYSEIRKFMDTCVKVDADKVDNVDNVENVDNATLS